MKKSGMLLVLVMVSVGVSLAETKRVAVLEVATDRESGASAKLKTSDVKEITGELRKEAVKNLPLATYRVMTSETVYAQGSAVLAECAEENCMITLGSRIGADYIVKGVISKFQNKYTLSVEIYETEDGNLVEKSETVRSEKIDDLLEKGKRVFADMYKSFVKKNSPSPLPPAAPPVPQNTQFNVDGSGWTFTDVRDGRKYRAVKIGNLMWMAENLKYQPKTGNSWCYDNDSNYYCNNMKYGRLYDWNTAKSVCPAGWHLPSRAEWDDLGRAVGGKKTPDNSGNIDWYGSGKKLKSRDGWNNLSDGSSGNGTDERNFTALPGGYRYSVGGFYDAGGYGNWWAATEFGGGGAYYRGMDYGIDYVSEYYIGVSNGFSVRCVGD